jgi:L-alanine-DL-glutamate epimerase-like enolase superfamily enzyme
MQDGYVDVPQGPGLGLEVDQEVLARYSVPQGPGLGLEVEEEAPARYGR